MPTFSEILSAAHADLHPISFLVIAPRLLAAVVIGVVLAARPWRLLLRRPLPRAQMIHAQILLCAAAAIVTIVIGESLAKAFGLVGLGSFVRFRSGLKDPRDAAVLFLVIGLGMACGHGALGVALTGSVFAAVLLAALDAFKVPEPRAEEEAAPRPAPAAGQHGSTA